MRAQSLVVGIGDRTNRSKDIDPALAIDATPTLNVVRNAAELNQLNVR